VVRYDDSIPSLVLGMRRRERDRVTWTLPKGTPITGETAEETAIREVGEETGLQVRITDRLPSIQYTFVQHGTRIYKTVHYFLMEPIGGDLASHDQEFEDVRWTRFDHAADLLAFETERNLVLTAAERLGAPVPVPATSPGDAAAPAGGFPRRPR
jgi:8-oxo-dGTP pyrophosphatase MutT (NUDIX family)